jgi:hypothetical protein
MIERLADRPESAASTVATQRPANVVDGGPMLHGKGQNDRRVPRVRVDLIPGFVIV